MNIDDKKAEVSDQELKKVIGDFLEMGHVENIAAMFRRHPEYYPWTGELLRDERFNVRLGLSVLFEDLQQSHPDQTPLAISSLVNLLDDDSSLLRGEATSILGIIGTESALTHITRMTEDPNPQVREVAGLILEENGAL
jgi:HEAT repeat protein